MIALLGVIGLVFFGMQKNIDRAASRNPPERSEGRRISRAISFNEPSVPCKKIFWLLVLGHATIDGPPVEHKQERKVRGIGEGAANQREETMEDGSLHSLRFLVVCHHAVHCGMAMEDNENSTQP